MKFRPLIPEVFLLSEPATDLTDEEIANQELTPEDQEMMQDEDNDELFYQQRAAIAERLKDEETMRLCIAEMYMSLNNMDKAVRSFAANGGIKSIVKAMFGGGG